jgi:hypothetical protein
MLKSYPNACKYIKKDGNFWFNYAVEEQEECRTNHKRFDNARIIQELQDGNNEALTNGDIAPQNIKSVIQGIQLLQNFCQPTWDLY